MRPQAPADIVGKRPSARGALHRVVPWLVASAWSSRAWHARLQHRLQPLRRSNSPDETDIGPRLVCMVLARV